MAPETSVVVGYITPPARFSATIGTSATAYPLSLDLSNSATLLSFIDNNMDRLLIQRLIVIVFSADPLEILMFCDCSDLNRTTYDIWSGRETRKHDCRMYQEPRKVNNILNRHWRKD